LGINFDLEALTKETLRSYEASPERFQAYEYNGRDQGERVKKAGVNIVNELLRQFYSI